MLFEETKNNDERYILIQSQFEFPQYYDVKLEADAGEWYAHLTVHRATLDRQRLVIDGNDDGESVRIIVNHTADEKTIGALTRVLKVMLPEPHVQ